MVRAPKSSRARVIERCLNLIACRHRHLACSTRTGRPTAERCIQRRRRRREWAITAACQPVDHWAAAIDRRSTSEYISFVAPAPYIASWERSLQAWDADGLAWHFCWGTNPVLVGGRVWSSTVSNRLVRTTSATRHEHRGFWCSLGPHTPVIRRSTRNARRRFSNVDQRSAERPLDCGPYVRSKCYWWTGQLLTRSNDNLLGVTARIGQTARCN